MKLLLTCLFLLPFSLYALDGQGEIANGYFYKFKSEAGLLYQVQTSEDLLAWDDYGQPLTGNGDHFTVEVLKDGDTNVLVRHICIDSLPDTLAAITREQIDAPLTNNTSYDNGYGTYIIVDVTFSGNTELRIFDARSDEQLSYNFISTNNRSTASFKLIVPAGCRYRIDARFSIVSHKVMVPVAPNS